MQTSMSVAFAQAGLITEEQSTQVNAIPYRLKPFTNQIQEIEKLANLFTQSGVVFNGTDTLMSILFQSMLSEGRSSEAYDMMLSHMKKKAKELNLAVTEIYS